MNYFRLQIPRSTIINYAYECIEAPDSSYLIASTAEETRFNSYGNGDVIYLNRHDVNCNGGIISDLRLVYDPENGEIQYKYTCNDYGNLFCFVTETVVVSTRYNQSLTSMMCTT